MQGDIPSCKCVQNKGNENRLVEMKWLTERGLGQADMVRRDGAWVSQGDKEKSVSTGTQNVKDAHTRSSRAINSLFLEHCF